MNTLVRRAFSFFSALSLLLFVTVACCWTRSYWRADAVARYWRDFADDDSETFIVETYSGSVILLRETFERWVAERACRLVTVLGVPGIGKSRLVREALDEIRTGAGIVVGRCPPYGEDITYLPLLDIVRQLAPAGAADLTALVEGEEDGELIADRVAGAVDSPP